MSKYALEWRGRRLARFVGLAEMAQSDDERVRFQSGGLMDEGADFWATPQSLGSLTFLRLFSSVGGRAPLLLQQAILPR